MSESLDQEIRTLQSIYWSERDPDGLAFAPLADAFLRRGEVREALDLLADGTSRHPDVTTGHIVASRLYLEQGMHGEAEFAVRRVLDLDPCNTVALSTLATILDDRGECDETATLRGMLEGLDPDSEELGSVTHEAAALPATDTGSLAPNPDGESEAESVSEVMEIGSLGPDPGSEAEPVLEAMARAALAPKPAADVMDFSSLVPDVDSEIEERPDVLEMDDIACVPRESPEMGNEEPLYTRTLAELYVKQSLVERALGVLHSLLEVDPGADDLRARIAELEGTPPPVDDSLAVMDRLGPEGGQGADTHAESTGEEASVEEERGTEEDVETLARDLADIRNHGDEVDTPFAWPEEEVEASESDAHRGDIGRYFDDMLNWTSDD